MAWRWPTEYVHFEFRIYLLSWIWYFFLNCIVQYCSVFNSVRILHTHGRILYSHNGHMECTFYRNKPCTCKRQIEIAASSLCTNVCYGGGGEVVQTSNMWCRQVILLHLVLTSYIVTCSCYTWIIYMWSVQVTLLHFVHSSYFVTCGALQLRLNIWCKQSLFFLEDYIVANLYAAPVPC